jgi:formylglycine-generating enzyme required for sulfatase activity
VRNANAKWFIPSESEWYKAAFYQPESKGGDADGYWNYPMRTNSVPFSDRPPGTTPDNTRVGNFALDDGINNGYNDGVPFGGPGDYRLTEGGAYNLSASYYGTFDQGGNVYEWNESISTVGSLTERVQRGGSYQSGPEILAATFRGLSSTSGGSAFSGFRVASPVPEPCSAGVIALAVSGIFVLQCLRRKPSVL